MRYLNLTMILASTVTLMLACGDSGGTDGTSDTGGTDAAGTAETTAETGDSNGDGDGDTGPGDGDGDTGPGDGDGDTGPGDGDGDTGPGDGDGDGDGEPGDGDGDGDAGCQPANDSPCAVCTAENCCDELMACQADNDCACLTECIGQGTEIVMCLEMCGIDPNGVMNAQLMALRECSNSSCMQECAMP